jgi:hypothetical protein
MPGLFNPPKTSRLMADLQLDRFGYDALKWPQFGVDGWLTFKKTHPQFVHRPIFYCPFLVLEMSCVTLMGAILLGSEVGGEQIAEVALGMDVMSAIGRVHASRLCLRCLAKVLI